MSISLLCPMGAYVFYMALIGVLNFVTRVRSVKSGAVPAKYFKALSGAEPPHHVVNIGRHYDNQFELPLLYFITCLTAIVADKSSEAIVILAWAFIATRLLHTWFHLGSNHILRRAGAFGLGWLVILIMWVVILVSPTQ